MTDAYRAEGKERTLYEVPEKMQRTLLAIAYCRPRHSLVMLCQPRGLLELPLSSAILAAADSAVSAASAVVRAEPRTLHDTELYRASSIICSRAGHCYFFAGERSGAMFLHAHDCSVQLLLPWDKPTRWSEDVFAGR